VSVDGGLDDVLHEVLLRALHYRHHALSVNDRLNLIDDVGLHLLLNDGLVLKDTALTGGRRLLNVFLNVMHHVVIYTPVQHWLYLHHSVLAYGLLDDGGQCVRLIGALRLVLVSSTCIE